MKLLCSLGVAISLLTTPVKAQDLKFDTGNDFLSQCTDDSVFLMYCLGLVRGTFETYTTLKHNAKVIENFPSNASNKQLLDVVLQYLRENLSVRHTAIEILTIMAYVSAWPRSPDE